MASSILEVIPAQAGIHAVDAPQAGCGDEMLTWIPACAGMTSRV
nr:hypothetical protein [uncultured Devosia sp.]